MKADIKIWILTGDKQETAINIGEFQLSSRSCVSRSLPVSPYAVCILFPASADVTHATFPHLPFLQFLRLSSLTLWCGSYDLPKQRSVVSLGFKQLAGQEQSQTERALWPPSSSALNQAFVLSSCRARLCGSDTGVLLQISLTATPISTSTVWGGEKKKQRKCVNNQLVCDSWYKVTFVKTKRKKKIDFK